jgi:hypothetical protein
MSAGSGGRRAFEGPDAEAWRLQAARRVYRWLNRLPGARHLGPVMLWIGLKPVDVGGGRPLRLTRAGL